MSDDLTKSIFDGVQRMIDASGSARDKALLVSVREMIDTAVKSVPAGERGEPGPQGPVGPAGPVGAAGAAGERGSDGAPGPQGPIGPAGEKGERGVEGAPGRDGNIGAPGPQGIVGPAGPQGEKGAEGLPGRDGRDALPMPGPQGPQGEKGMDGRDGKDGKDGRDSDITRAELDAAIAKAVEENTERVLKSITFDPVTRELKVLGRVIVKLYVPIYRGVFAAVEKYVPGDMVTWAGSTWHCNNETTEKPGTNGDWTLAVKQGRDGRDRTK